MKDARPFQADSRRWRWRGLTTRFHLFLLATAGIIGGAVVSSALLMGVFFERYILAHEQEHMILEVVTESRPRLTAPDFEPATVRPGVFRGLLETLPGVSSITAFDRSGRVVWSSEERPIGRTVVNDPSLTRALAGEGASRLEGTREYAVKTYVPIALPGSQGLTGVVETSKDFTGVVLKVRHTQRLILGVAAGMGLLLYLALGFLAWRVSGAERRAIKRLEVQNRELVLIQRFTHSLLASLDPGRLAADIVSNVASGLELARASLCRVNEGDELTTVAEWKGKDSDGRPLLDRLVAVEAARTRRPVVQGATMAVPLSALFDVPAAPTDVSRRARAYLFVAEFKQPQPAVPLLLDIMLHEAAIALAHAGLFSAIREAHAQLAAILAGIADSMVILDRDMRLAWMNGVAKEIYGDRGNLLGRPCFDALGGGVSCEECPALRTFRSGKVERGMRTERLAGGGVRHFDLVTAPLLDSSGSVHHVLEVARDITESVELERQLKHSAARLEESHAALLAKTRELEAANRALGEAQAQLVEKERLAAAGEVVIGLHHSVLNPLTGILGALQVLKQEDIRPGERDEAFGQAQAAIHKIEQVVRGLSTLRRVAAMPYVGKSSMLDLERSCREDEAG